MKAIIKAGMTFTVLLFAQSALAEVNRIEMSAAAWGADIAGGFEIKEVEYTVHTDEFEFDTEVSSFFIIAVESENKYAPDVSFGVTSTKHTAPGAISFSGTTISVENGTIDLSHAELNLYYSVFQNDVVDINLGLSAKYFYGDFSLEGLSDGTSEYTDTESSLTTALPMLYASIDFQPIKSLNAYVTLQGGSYDDQSGHDVTLGIDYIFKNNVGLGLGYRQFETVQSAESGGAHNLDVELDMKVSGGFLRVFYQQ